MHENHRFVLLLCIHLCVIFLVALSHRCHKMHCIVCDYRFVSSFISFTLASLSIELIRYVNFPLGFGGVLVLYLLLFCRFYSCLIGTMASKRQIDVHTFERFSFLVSVCLYTYYHARHMHSTYHTYRHTALAFSKQTYE